MIKPEEYIENRLIRHRARLGYKDALVIRRPKMGRGGFGCVDVMFLPIACPPQHDCSYCRARGALVDHAARIASKRVTVGYGDKIGTASQRWTKVFASEMDRLAAQLGL